MKASHLAASAVLALAAFVPANAADDATFEKQVRPILAKHCLGCHGAEKPKGDLRLDALKPDFAERTARSHWLDVLKRVQAGEMPPEGKPRLSDRDAQVLIEWIGRGAKAAEAAEGRVVLRRLNRVEYENTVRDLLLVDADLKDFLPADGSANGFDTNAEALHLSPFLLEKYLDAAEVALNFAIANNPKPPALVKKRLLMKDERHVKVTTEKVFRHRPDDLVMFSSSQWQSITVSQFYPPDRGRYRFRISAFAVQSRGKPVPFRIDAGPMLMGTKNHLNDYYDAPPDTPTVFEFTEHLEARSTIRILPYGLASAQEVNKIGADTYTGPGLAVQWVEVEGPLHESWPPSSHRRLFGEQPQGPAPAFNNRNRVEVVSTNPEADAARVLRGFVRRAYRRDITDADIAPFLALVKAKLTEKHTFEQAMRVGLKAVLVSPEFLFRREKPGQLDGFALASRLSYFLWSTMPDEELLALAAKGTLHEPAVLRGQVERLLQNPKAKAFTENFVGQWLGLRDIDFTTPEFRLYPEFDEMLKASMLRETYLFFDELLRHDLSAANVVASDFTMLNGRLAKHYSIPGIDGWTFRKTTLPPGSRRGGVMTMASVLKVTANGTTTSPVVRGAWVLDRILGTPPAPPPDGVPAVEPDIRGATTIRDQLAKHRQIPSCASCHAKIDPPGFALESYDAIGGWRDNYRVLGSGGVVMVDGRRMPYHKGKAVDPSDALADGTKFRDIDEFKQLLLRDKDQLARALASKLLTYSTGKPPGPTDRDAVEAIVRTVREKNYGLRALIHEIVLSKLFQTK